MNASFKINEQDVERPLVTLHVIDHFKVFEPSSTVQIHYSDCPCAWNLDTLPNLMEKFGHDKLEILKLDIEGGEWAVLGQPFIIYSISFCYSMLLTSYAVPLICAHDLPQIPWLPVARMAGIMY